jgi:hypothetical protein
MSQFTSQLNLVPIQSISQLANYDIDNSSAGRNLGTVAGASKGRVRGVSIFPSSGTCYVNEKGATATASTNGYTKSYAAGTPFYLPFGGKALDSIYIFGGTASIVFLTELSDTQI